jgi:glycosylphosphatidylinositol phospholipase D
MRSAFISNRAPVRRRNPLRGAVRRSLRLSSGAIAAGLTLGVTPIASAAPFPAVFELSSLLPANGGDGSAGFVLDGDAVRDLVGFAVSTAGDINGDGVDDIIVGAPYANPDAREDAGAGYVLFGTTQGFPAERRLADLFPDNGGDGSAGFVIQGGRRGDLAGWSVRAAGDINGDGIGDLIIGAPRTEAAGRVNVGQAYVVFGRNAALSGPFPALFDVRTLLPPGGGDGSAGFAIQGIGGNDYNGEAVSGAGDINGDGIGDLLINSRTSPHDHFGVVNIVFGRDTPHGDPFPAVFQTESLLPYGGGDGSTGFVIRRSDEDESVAFALDGAGDVNGDGIADVILGSGNADPAGRANAGITYLVFGRNTSQTGNFPPVIELVTLLPFAGGDGSDGFLVTGIRGSGFRTGDASGASVSKAGDVNDDGIDDIVIGAIFAYSGDRIEAGQSYVVFGRDSALAGNFPAQLPLASLLPGAGGDGSRGFVMTGVRAYDGSGIVSNAGDVNGDGIADLVIGAPSQRSSNHPGSCYVVFGQAHFAPVFPLATLLPDAGGDGHLGFVLQGITIHDLTCTSVSTAGDVNGDGVDDLVIGADGAHLDGRSYAGAAFVVFGRAGE